MTPQEIRESVDRIWLERERYRTALAQVKFEMEKSGLSLVQHSVIYQIVCKALEEA